MLLWGWLISVRSPHLLGLVPILLWVMLTVYTAHRARVPFAPGQVTPGAHERGKAAPVSKTFWALGVVIPSLIVLAVTVCGRARLPFPPLRLIAVGDGCSLAGAALAGEDLRFVHAAPGHVLDLSGAELSRATLADADLSNAKLTAAGLVGADLRGAKLQKARLDNACLFGATFSSETDLGGAALLGADFSHVDAHMLSSLPGDRVKGDDATRLPASVVAGCAACFPGHGMVSPEPGGKKCWERCQPYRCCAAAWGERCSP
jgi:hypothetical protein